jgi:hypothetical protein
MISVNELRLGNHILHKTNHKISKVVCAYHHFALMEKGDIASFFPILLKPELLLQCGFIENKDYPLAPQAKEFRLLLPINGAQQNEIVAYIKSTGEGFARAVVDGKLPVSHNIYHLHQLQNVFFFLTGKELEIKS